MASTFIGSSGTCRILNNANIIAPCSAAMQKGAKKVNAILQNINEKSLRQIRTTLVYENARVWQKAPCVFNHEGDSSYNNPIS